MTDPNYTLAGLRAHLAAGSTLHALNHARNLITHLDAGGILPDAWQPFTAAPAPELDIDDDQVDDNDDAPTTNDRVRALSDALYTACDERDEARRGHEACFDALRRAQDANRPSPNHTRLATQLRTIADQLQTLETR